MQQGAQDGGIQARSINDRAAGLDDSVPVKNAASARSDDDFVQQICAACSGYEQAAVETYDQRVAPRLVARPCSVQVHALGNQRAARVQVDRQTVVPCVGGIARGLMNDLSNG